MQRPQHTISETAKDEEYHRLCARYYSAKCIPAIDEKKARILYRAINGELEESDYLYVTNPLNSKVDKFKRFPSRIRNFDILSPVGMMLMGEKRRRGLNYTVVARNSNTESQRAELQNQLVDRMLVQQLINEVVAFKKEQGEEIDIAQEEQLTVEKVQKRVASLQDNVAIMGQEALDYIRDYNNLDSKFVENWFHFITTGRAFSFKEPWRDEVTYKPVSPMEIGYLANSETRCLEDCEAVKRLSKMPVTEVIDKFQGVKGWTDDIKKDLETKYGYVHGEHEGFSNANPSFGVNDIDPGIAASSTLWNKIHRGDESAVFSDADGISVEHVVWTSMVKVGRLKGTNIFGEAFEHDVDEDYKAQAGETVEWEWVKQKRHAYIIDDRFVIGGEALPYTQDDIRKPGACKNPYNGIILNMKHVNPMSIIEKGLPYQIKYNIIHYYIEKVMAKNMDKIVLMPVGLIAREEGHTTESTMYYAQSTGFLFIDESKKNVQAALNAVKILDASLSQHIDKLYQYLSIVKQEWKALVGSTPAREGEAGNAVQGKAIMENSIFRSSIMTEEYFAQMEELEQSELQGLLNVSKFAFSEGKKAIFLNKDRKRTMLNIDPEQFFYGDYLIRVANSGKDLEELERAKANAQAVAQNANGKLTPMLKLLKSNNISQIMEEMEVMEMELEQRMAQQAEQEQRVALEIEQTRERIADKELEFKYYDSDQKASTSIRVKEMDVEARLRSEFMNTENADSDTAAFLQDSREREKISKDEQLKREEIRSKERQTTETNETRKYVADKSIAVAKENK